MQAKLFKPIDVRLRSFMRRQRKTIAKALACLVINGALTAATIPLIKYSVQAIEDASLSKAGPSVGGSSAALARLQGAGNAKAPATEDERRDAVYRLALLCLAVVGVYAGKYAFTRGHSFYFSRAVAELSADLRVRMFTKLQRLPISYFNERRSGAIQSVLSNDVTVFQNAVNIVRDSVDAPVKALSSFAVILVLQPLLALIVVLFLPAYAYVIFRNGRQMRQAQRKVQDDLAELSAMTQEAISGTRVVKAFSAEERILGRYRGLIERALRSQLQAARRLATLKPMVELLGSVALATAMYVCGWLAFGGMLRVADIAALIYAMDVVNQGFRSWGHVNNTYGQVQAAADRIFSQVLDVEEEHAASAGKLVLEQVRGRVEFRDVRFTYPDGTEALSGVSFVIEPGTSLALVGPSGAGKSTIADLLLRFYDPTQGSILFDGVDVRELDAAWYRSQIGVVPQHTFLFAGTIADNVRLGMPDASDEEIAEAARAAHATEFVAAMPNGFASELGERGIRLSGGEMQRIAIARALVRKPGVLILDEATSNLDSVSERAVQAALDEAFLGRTTLVIAHRLTTAARSDRILVLRRGEVIESGSHRELLEKDGVYAGMYRAFSSGVLDESIV